MNRKLRVVAHLSWAAIFAVACDREEPTRFNSPAVNPDVVRQAANLSLLAAQQLSAAVGGRKDRGEQDEMLRVEAQLPGFGGFYIDSVGDVIALLKSSSGRTPQNARSALSLAYGMRKESVVREIMAPADRAQVINADYSLSELIAIEQLISRNSAPLSGFTGVGTDIVANRVRVFFKDAQSTQAGLSRIRALGVSDSILALDIMPPARATSNFTDVHRPSKAGIMIQVGEPWGPPQAESIYVASHGYNVCAGQFFPIEPSQCEWFFLIAGHAPVERYQTLGHVGAPVYQNSSLRARYGVVLQNPPWYPCQGYQFCTRADVALARHDPGITYEQKVSVSNMRVSTEPSAQT